MPLRARQRRNEAVRRAGRRVREPRPRRRRAGGHAGQPPRVAERVVRLALADDLGPAELVRERADVGLQGAARLAELAARAALGDEHVQRADGPEDRQEGFRRDDGRVRHERHEEEVGDGLAVRPHAPDRRRVRRVERRDEHDAADDLPRRQDVPSRELDARPGDRDARLVTREHVGQHEQRRREEDAGNHDDGVDDEEERPEREHRHRVDSIQHVVVRARAADLAVVERVVLQHAVVVAHALQDVSDLRVRGPVPFNRRREAARERDLFF
mmetsp:Transcript_2766/g.8351  ORF Transcript_2766/g.8351 Transcript_2766/m.8351 type:complete len:271 (+) Transcript_2766:47-859(+)